METATPGSEGAPAAASRWQIGDWLADARLDELRRGEAVVKLEPRTMRLLLALAERPGEVLTLDELLNEVWADLVVSSNSVYQAVSQLRQVLGDEASRPRYIATVPRKGYRLVAAVRPVTDPATPPRPGAAGAGAPPQPVLPPPPQQQQQPVPPLASPASAPRGLSRRGWVLAGGGALVLGAGGLAAWRHRESLAPDQVRLAVLPFQDQSTHKLEQPLADGLAEQVIGALARHRQVQVLSRATSFQFQQAQALLPLAQQQLVTHVLEGALVRRQDRLSLSLRLHRLPRQALLWQEVLEVERINLGGLALQVANQALQALGAVPVQESAQPPVPADAYELYLIGLQHQRTSQREGILQAREYFQRAIDTDPGFALAYVGQAMSWVAEFHYGAGLSFRDMHARAQPLLDRALQLNPQLPLALGAQGHLKSNMSQHAEARRWLAQALALAPHEATLLNWSAGNESEDGRPLAAGALFEQALRLSPLSFQTHHLAGVAAIYAGRYPQAQAHYQRSLALAPQHANGHWGLGIIGYARGDLVEAVRGYRKALLVDGRREHLWAQLAWLYLDLGQAEEARQALRQAEALSAAPLGHRLSALRAHLLTDDLAGLDAGLRALALPRELDREWQIEQALLQTVLGRPGLLQAELDQAVGLVLADPVPAANSWWMFQGQHLLLDAAAVYHAQGRPERAEPLLSQAQASLQRLVSQGNVWHATGYHLARIAAMRAQPEAALRALEQAVRGGWRRIWWLRHDPALAALRALPGWPAWLSRIAPPVAPPPPRSQRT